MKEQEHSFKSRRIGFDRWVERYRPINRSTTPGAALGGLVFLPAGSDLNFVRQQPWTRIWSLLVSDAGWHIVNGFHLVNREGYFVTEKHFEKSEVFNIRY